MNKRITPTGIGYNNIDIVKKVWGEEKILEANSNYTVKIMTLEPGGQCSHHLHRNKKESFILLEGELFVLITMADGERKTYTLNEKFETITLNPMTTHCFYCKSIQKNPTIFMECSTFDEPEDSYRFTKSS